jgi:hypothetical protein
VRKCSDKNWVSKTRDLPILQSSKIPWRHSACPDPPLAPVCVLFHSGYPVDTPSISREWPGTGATKPRMCLGHSGGCWIPKHPLCSVYVYPYVELRTYFAQSLVVVCDVRHRECIRIRVGRKRKRECCPNVGVLIDKPRSPIFFSATILRPTYQLPS